MEHPDGEILLTPLGFSGPAGAVQGSYQDPYKMYDNQFALIRYAKIYGSRVGKLDAVLVESQLKDKKASFDDSKERFDKYSIGCLLNNCNKTMLNMTLTPFGT